MSTPPSSAAASPTDPNYAFVNVVTDGNWPDSMGKAPKTRKRITKTQLAMLEELFRQCSHPSREERQTLAAKTGMELRSVTIWLQNKRQLVKKNAKLGLETATSSSATSPEPAQSDDDQPQPPQVKKRGRPSLDRVASLSEFPSPVRPIIKRTNSTNTQVTEPEPIWAHMPSSPPSSPPSAPAGRTRASKVHPQVHKIAGRPYPVLTRTMSVDSASTCVSTASSSSSSSTSLRRRATERAKLIKPSMTLEWACAQAATREGEESTSARAPSPTPTLLEDSSAEMEAALALCGLIHAAA